MISYSATFHWQMRHSDQMILMMPLRPGAALAAIGVHSLLMEARDVLYA
jgi:hypothetical protein